MFRSLLVVASLASVASADKRVYDIRPTTKVDMSDSMYPSCGATRRMLKEKHVMVIDDDDNVTIDGLSWQTQVGEPDLLVSFHYGKGQKTYLLMDMYVNQRGLSGKYILVGVIPDQHDPRIQETCTDAIYLDGTARQ